MLSLSRRLLVRGGGYPSHASLRGLHLSPREADHLQLHNAGRLAQYRLARGVRLNVPESIALITMQMMEFIRDGDTSVADLMSIGQTLLGRRNVMPGVPKMVSNVQIEATFPDGTKLLTVHSPISNLEGDLAKALQGSFLPAPDCRRLVPSRRLIADRYARSTFVL